MIMPTPQQDRFVNPYTFVGLGAPNRRLSRAEPAGHDRLAADRYMGVIEGTAVALSPLLIRVPSGQGTAHFPRRPVSHQPYLPGSSLHGALRSMHEVLAGGCLRIVDADYVPTYRSVAKTDEDWEVGVVDRAGTDDTPPAIRLCSQHTRLQLAGHGAAVDPDRTPPTTGDRFLLRLGQVVSLQGRSEFTAAPHWRILITDARARPADGGYWAVLGLVDPRARPLSVTDQAWATFRRLAADTNDWRVACQHGAEPSPATEPAPVTEEVHFPASTGRLVGYRHRVRPWLLRDQLVWVRHHGNEIISVKLAVIWREPGSGAVRDRVPTDLLPCTNERSLCPSCRIFGSAETESSLDLREAEQHSYRGHVRAFDAELLSDHAVESVRLAPMGRPHPGAGQFYLDQTGVDAQEKEPVARWGSSADTDGWRQLRGRKFYWRTDVDAGRQRGLARPWSPPQFVTDIEQLPTGSTFRVQLRFENLTTAEIGGLVAALAPDLFLRTVGITVGSDTDPHVLPVGGGKPFGCGSLHVHDIKVTLETAGSRYLAAKTPTAGDVTALLGAFADAVDDSTRRSWPELAAAIQFRRINDLLTWYPPGEYWPDDFDPAHPHAGLVEKHDAVSRFWARSAGQINVDHHHGRLVPLPAVENPDQTLEIEV